MAFTLACQDPESGPIFIYSDLEVAGYPRLAKEEGSDPDELYLVDLDNFSDFSYTYAVEFVDGLKETKRNLFPLTWSLRRKKEMR